MNARVKPGSEAARATALARAAVTMAEHVAKVERLLADRGALSTQDIMGAIARTKSRAMAVAAVVGLRRSDESAEHARNAPVFHARDLETALAAQRAWLASRAERSPAVVEPRRLQTRPRRHRPRVTDRTPGVAQAIVALPVARLRAPLDMFSCSALGARLSAGACVARQRSERIECFICRDCDVGREVARRVRT